MTSFIKAISVALLFAIASSATVSAQAVDATFRGGFTSNQTLGDNGGILTFSADIPFTSVIQIFGDAPRFFDYSSQNTTQTLFSGPAFNTSHTATLLEGEPVVPADAIYYSFSIYSFGDLSAATRTDFVAFASGSVFDETTGNQLVYQLVIRRPITVTSVAGDDIGPFDTAGLIAGLSAAQAAGLQFNVTEFYDIYSSTGHRLESNWYVGAATLDSMTTVTVVPEPSSFVLFGFGLVALVLIRGSFSWTRVGVPCRFDGAGLLQVSRLMVRRFGMLLT